MKSCYVVWLEKQGVPLFKAGDLYWRLYRGALVPAPATPYFIELSHDEAKALLRESGAWFLRYSSNPCEEPSEWWHIVCDAYDPKKLSSNTRSKINRGNRICSVRQIDVEWLANHGYECYVAAYDRYKNTAPASEEVFRNSLLATVEGPFGYWGVFVEDRLAGYCQCIIEGNKVDTSVIKYNPVFLKHYSSYALINGIINHYVVERGMSITNGTRSIAHDTNIQDFLLKFGFRKQYCRLNVFYQPWLKFAVQTLFPLRGLIAHLPNRGPVHKLQVLLFQEELRRKCNPCYFLKRLQNVKG